MKNRFTGGAPFATSTTAANEVNGSVFYTKDEFGFIANEVSYNTLMNEACRLLVKSPEMLNNEVNIFRNSINRNPGSFQVPEEGSDNFFRKMNLGLYLINLVGNYPQTAGAAPAPTYRLSSPQMIRALTLIKQKYVNNGQFTPDHAALIDAVIADLRAGRAHGPNIEQVRPGVLLLETNGGTAAGQYKAAAPLNGAPQSIQDLDNDGNGNSPPAPPSVLLTVLHELSTSTSFGRQINPGKGIGHFGKFSVGGNPMDVTSTKLLNNIGTRLAKDPYYRENNFREILQEVGMSMDEFARLVENSVSIIFWPDCIASKSTESDLRFLIKGLGLGVSDSDLANKSKPELCSLILTSSGLKPSFFEKDFNMQQELGLDGVQHLKEVIRAVKLLKTGENFPGGYLGFAAGGADLGNPNNRKITVGAYLMTGFTAHNVTTDKAIKWLSATGVDHSTVISFKNYSDNDNVFDLLEKRRTGPRTVNTKMEFTGEGVERRLGELLLG